MLPFSPAAFTIVLLDAPPPLNPSPPRHCISCDTDIHKIDTSVMLLAHASAAFDLLQDIPRPIALNAVLPQLLACPGYGFANVLLEVACEAAQSIEADAIPQASG